MQPFVDQLVALGKDVRKLKGEASEDEESSKASEDVHTDCDTIVKTQEGQQKAGAVA